MSLLTQHEEAMKMFDEMEKKITSNGGFKYDVGDDYEPYDYDTEAIKSFLLTQLRLARADERKQAYEDGKNGAVEYVLLHWNSKENDYSSVESIEETGRWIDATLKQILESARKA